jgi:hypothetical protein
MTTKDTLPESSVRSISQVIDKVMQVELSGYEISNEVGEQMVNITSPYYNENMANAEKTIEMLCSTAVRDHVINQQAVNVENDYFKAIFRRMDMNSL